MNSERDPVWPLSWTCEGEGGEGRREGVKWERLGRGAARHSQNHHTLSLTTTRPATHCWPFRDPTLARQFVTTLTLSPPPYLGRDTSVANRFDHGSHERSESGLRRNKRIWAELVERAGGACEGRVTPPMERRKLRTSLVTFTSVRGDRRSAAMSSGDCAWCKSVFFCSSNGTFGSAPPPTSATHSVRDFACV